MTPLPGPLVGIPRDYSVPTSKQSWWQTTWGKESGWDMEDDAQGPAELNVSLPGQSSPRTIGQERNQGTESFRRAVTNCRENCSGPEVNIFLVKKRPRNYRLASTLVPQLRFPGNRAVHGT